MNSLILTTATRAVKPLLLVSSLVVLLRGHNDPGGGFVGGLLAAAAFALQAISDGTEAARRSLRADPHVILAAGLILAAASGVWALFKDQPFLTGQWWSAGIGRIGLKFGTVILFDAGVYLVVLGAVLLTVFTMAEE